jgi:hypothetical protein
MAKRQDSGSNSAQQNQRPNSHNEDALPEMTEETRGLASDEDEDDFDASEDVDEEEEDSDEGNY